MKLRLSSWWILPVVITVDQATKWLASQFNLVQLNQGVAFGWGRETQTWILSSVIILILWLIFRIRHQARQYQTGLILIITGGLSNLFDRIIWGGVRDFMPMIWWRNNIADLAIILGIIWLVRQTYVTLYLAKKNYV